MSPESVTCKVIALKGGKATARSVILQMKRETRKQLGTKQAIAMHDAEIKEGEKRNSARSIAEAMKAFYTKRHVQNFEYKGRTTDIENEQQE